MVVGIVNWLWKLEFGIKKLQVHKFFQKIKWPGFTLGYIPTSCKKSNFIYNNVDYAKPGVNPATYVMAPPTASASPIVTPTSVYPTSTYHPYPPPQATPVAAAAAPVQVYDANTKTSYYAQPPVSPIKSAYYLFME